MRGRDWIGCALAAALVAAACGSPSATGTATHNPTSTGGFDFQQALLDHSTDEGPVARTELVSVDLQLQERTSLVDKAAGIYDPSSPSYMHFTSPDQLASGVGPDAQAVARASAQLKQAGLEPAWTPGERALSVTATVQAIDRVFQVDVHHFKARSGQEFEASRALPTLPAGLDPVVIAVAPINTYSTRRTAAIPEGGLTPKVTWNAYNTQPLHDLGIDGKGETVSIYALGDGFNQNELNDWASKMGLPPVTPVVKGGSSSAKEGLELMMDIEVVHEVAPGAQIFVYSQDQKSVFTSAATVAAFYDQMIKDNPGGIWSMSWGGCEQGDSPALRSLEADQYAKAAAAGISAFHSTGDSAAYDCMTADWGAPPSDKSIGVELESALPLGVTAVGGTRISVRQDGSYYQEVAWSEPLTTEGGGGGVTQFFQQPSWQRGPGVDKNQYNPSHMRMTPDVSADADPTTGLAIEAGGSMQMGGGTSQATPLWAGMNALFNQYLKSKGEKPVGFLAPALYDIAAGHPPVPAFHDVTLGNNLHYPATPGYDLCTGLGTPDAAALARDLEEFQHNGGKI